MMKKTMLLLMVLSMLLTVCFPAGAFEAQAGETLEAELPASFDLRNVDTDGDGIGDRCYVTPVKFQNPFATCWVFSSIAAAEISLLGSVYANDPDAWKTLDLSEKHLGYFSHVLLNDPSSPQNGEGTTSKDLKKMFDLYGGGSTIMAMWSFAQGIGPADEHPNLPGVGEAFEYHGKDRVVVVDYIDGALRSFHYSDEDDWTIPDAFRFHQDYIMTDAHLLPNPAQKDENDEYVYNEAGTRAIKQQLLQKRGVAIGLVADVSTPSALSSTETKYISTNWAHYAWDFGSSNHAVTIVGWDDNYSKENFLAEHQPPADGAWLCKNSWGSAEEAFPFYASGDWGIENEEGKHTGYFWVSYYDHSLTEPFSLELKPAAALQSVDQHDYFLANALNPQTYGYPVSMANVFKADHTKTLRAISCITGAENTSVHYQVYLLQNAYQTPEDGLMVAEGETAFVDAGYHRIPLGDILVQKDQYFSVIETQRNQDGMYEVISANTYFDESVQVAIVNERESYLRQNDQWKDYRTVLDEQASEDAMPLSYDNFPIKVYSDRAANDVKMRLRLGDGPLSMLEGYNTASYRVQFVAENGFEMGKPSIVWQPLSGSEGLVEMEPKKDGTAVDVTAKAPGTGMFSVTAEGFGTAVFPITVTRGCLDHAITIVMDPEYTGQEIIPLIFAYGEDGAQLTEGEHYQVTFENNIRCGLGRVVITGIGPCEDPDAEPLVDYFSIVPRSPQVLSLSGESGEIRLTVEDLSEIGADGYEVQYRLKGAYDWSSASFEGSRTDLVISGLAAGEYELQVRGLVDNREADLSDLRSNVNNPEANAGMANSYKRIEYGSYGELQTVIVP